MTVTTSPPLLQLSAMTRTFPGVIANKDVDLTIHAGEIHALLGENGAGKSTLVKMIYGILAPDSGTIQWQGKTVNISNPAFARELGVAMVFQHFSLFDSLSVLENIALGMDGKVNRAELKSRILDISNRYGLPLDPDRHVYTLSVGERQRIEIIRCLLQNPKLLIMDEPTSVLTPQEVLRLFETLRRLSEEGLAILYISHKLDEIKALCHRATILRNGERVDMVEVESESASSLAAKMMGEALETSAPRTGHQAGSVRLSVKNLTLAAADEFGIPLKNINLDVRCGEIVGIAGVAGNGQDELLMALSGETVSKTADSICIDGKSCGQLGPNQRRGLGFAAIPEQRLGHGAVPEMSLVDNTFLTAFQRLGLVSGGFTKSGATKAFAEKVIRGFNVKTNGSQALASSLSGGNLQKFIVGREILQSPGLLIVSQPTWGVDAGAAQTIHKALRELADQGAAVLIISQDLDELMAGTDRIGAICAGELSQVYDTATLSIEEVGLLMAGSGLKAQPEVEVAHV